MNLKMKSQNKAKVIPINKKRPAGNLFLYFVLLVLLFVLIISKCGHSEAAAQSKQVSISDSIPPYRFSIPPEDFRIIDSILLVAIKTTGYQLSAPDADNMRNALGGVRNYFLFQKAKQDTVVNKPKK